MKKNITQMLQATRPTLSPSERSRAWQNIHASLTPQPLRSPYSHVTWLSHASLIRVLAVIALVVGGGVTTVAAHEARPGDALFPLDRALERIELKLARSEERRNEIAIAHAEERLSELKILIHTSGSTTPYSVTATTSSHTHLNTAVDALMDVLDKSHMSDTARERIYENFFDEIDPLSVDMHIDSKQKKGSLKERVNIEHDERGETKIEIREENKRTRIEKRDGRVHIEYDENVPADETGDITDTKGKDDKSRTRNTSDD